MAEQWIGTPAVYGYFSSTSTRPWTPLATYAITRNWNTTSARRYGYVAWSNVPLPGADSVIHADLRIENINSGSSRTPCTPQFYLGHVPPPADGVPILTVPLGEEVGEASIGQVTVFDVTDHLRDALETNWQEGDTLGLHLQYGGSAYERGETHWVATLTVDYVPNVQEVNPVTVHVPVTVGGVEVEFSVNPASVLVPVTVGAVDIVAPRSLSPVTVHVPVTVGATSTHGTGDGPSLDQAATVHVPVTVGQVALVVTIKPPPVPPPWERVAALPEYQAALTARHATIDSRVEVIDENDVVIATFGGDNATHAGMISGSVQVNSDNPVWWEATLQVDQAEIAPTTVGDLFHPLSHNRIRVWWRILINPDTGQWAEIPVGTVYPDWPDVTDTGDAEVSITVQGQDAAYLISQAKMDNSVTVGGQRGDEAIRAILTDAAPWAPLSLDRAERRLPAEYEAGEPGADPWDVCREIATSTGMLLHVDRMGVIRLTKRPDPAAPPVAEFVEGETMAVTEVATSVPMDRIRNKVVVHVTATQDADGNDIEPFSVTATVDDETHPLWVGHGHLYVEHVNTDQVIDRDQAMSMAEGILAGRVSLSETGSIKLFPQPHINPLENVTVVATRAGMIGTKQITAWSLALGPLGGMEAATVGRREW